MEAQHNKDSTDHPPAVAPEPDDSTCTEVHTHPVKQLFQGWDWTWGHEYPGKYSPSELHVQAY